MPNQIKIIAPYWQSSIQTWVFDDARTGLVQEPFVSGAPEMIDYLVRDIPSARSGFRLVFSAEPFAGHQHCIERVREDCGGNWYRLVEPPMEGWLCPALFRYFDEAPPQLYVRAEALSS